MALQCREAGYDMAEVFMPPQVTFDALIEAAELLSPDERAEFIEVLQKRLAAQGHQRVLADIRTARSEFQAGQTGQVSVDDLMREIES